MTVIKNNLSILFPTGAFFPAQIGGPCNTLYWHTSELSANNINISVVTTSLGIKSGLVPLNKRIQNSSGYIYYADGRGKYIKAFREIMRESRKADIIHLNSLFDPLSIFSFFYSKIFLNKKVVWSIRGELNENALKFSRWKKIPLIFMYKFLTQNVLFHSTSRAESSDLKVAFPKSEFIELPNFLKPSERFNNILKKDQLLFVGRIHPIKGLHKLIEALSISRFFTNSEFKMSFVGGYEKRHENYFYQLKALVNNLGLESKVQFEGHLSGIQKDKKYAESFFLILPSETENFGNVVVESLNQGTPVIASKGTPWSLLETFDCGYHVENDPTLLASKIDEILKLSEDSYNKKRNNSLKLVDERFNIKAQIFRWIKVYISLKP